MVTQLRCGGAQSRPCILAPESTLFYYFIELKVEGIEGRAHVCVLEKRIGHSAEAREFARGL